MGGVRTSIFGRPRRLPGHRRAATYTVNCEEPVCSHELIDLRLEVTQYASRKRPLALGQYCEKLAKVGNYQFDSLDFPVAQANAASANLLLGTVLPIGEKKAVSQLVCILATHGNDKGLKDPSYVLIRHVVGSSQSRV